MNFLNKIFLWITGGKLSHFDQSQISKGTLQSILVQGISIILVFASNLLWVKVLGPDEYGIFIHIFNWVSILSIVALGGREDLLLAELPKYHEQNDNKKISNLIGYANSSIIARSALIITIFLLLIYFVPVRSLSEYFKNFLYAAIAIFFSAFIILNQLALQALHQIKLSQLVDKVVKPLLLVLIALLFYTANIPANAQTFILTNVGVLAVCGGILFIIVNKFHHYTTLNQKTNFESDLQRKTIYFFLISLLYMLSTRINMLALTYYNPGSDTGVFNICYRFAELLIFPNYLLHFVLPQLFSRNSLSGIPYNQSLFTAATRFMLVLTLPMLLLLLFFGKFLLHWFGYEFTLGYNCLVFLAISQSVFAFAGPCNTILMTQDKEKYAAIALLIYCVVLTLSNLTLIPSMGITGSGLAFLISSVVYNGVLIVVTFRKSKVLSPALRIFTQAARPASSQ